MKPATDNIPHTINAAGVKEEARRLGFHACGLSSASEVDGSHTAFFDRWLDSGRHAGMQYMERYREIRHDPRLLMENTRTIVSVAMAYRPQKELAPHNPQIAWYAYGKDYHLLVGQRLRELLVRLQARYGTQLHGRAICDTAPLLERYWAWHAGLGWIGKHTQLVIPHAGSAFFLGELLLDAEADTYDTPLPNQCGQCKRQHMPQLPDHRKPRNDPFPTGRRTTPTLHLRLRPLSQGLPSPERRSRNNRNMVRPGRRTVRHDRRTVAAALAGRLSQTVQGFGRETCKIRRSHAQHRRPVIVRRQLKQKNIHNILLIKGIGLISGPLRNAWNLQALPTKFATCRFCNTTCRCY